MGSFPSLCQSQEAVSTIPMSFNSNEIPHTHNSNVCPICYEEKDDLEQIPHWEAKGDVSGHKMCSDCTKQYRKDHCPFCNEVTLKDEMLNKIKNLILDVQEKSVEGDPNSLAAILESWQFFELEYESNPRVIHRVCTMIMKDDDFKNLLQDGITLKLPWMRDGAGLFFRLYGLSLDGHLEISDSEKALLKDCYETILASLRTVKSQGHYYGALYTQVMVPFVCAYRSGQESDNLKNIVKTVGNAVVDLYLEQIVFYPDLKWQIPQRIENLYMNIVTTNVWGGTSEDPIWKAFYANNS